MSETPSLPANDPNSVPNIDFDDVYAQRFNDFTNDATLAITNEELDAIHEARLREREILATVIYTLTKEDNGVDKRCDNYRQRIQLILKNKEEYADVADHALQECGIGMIITDMLLDGDSVTLDGVIHEVRHTKPLRDVSDDSIRQQFCMLMQNLLDTHSVRRDIS